MAVIFIRRSTGGIGIVFDASLSEGYAVRASVTRFPVEEGIVVSDHVRREPDEITINGIVTDAPMLVNGEMIPPRADRIAAAFETLSALVGQRLDVSTSLRSFTDMLITSIGVTRDAARGIVLDATVTLTQIRTATTILLDLPAPLIPQAKRTKNDGVKTGTPVEKEINESYARKLRNQLSKLGASDGDWQRTINEIRGSL